MLHHMCVCHLISIGMSAIHLVCLIDVYLLVTLHPMTKSFVSLIDVTSSGLFVAKLKLKCWLKKPILDDTIEAKVV